MKNSKGNSINILEYQIKQFIEEIRPKEEIRDEIDFGYSFVGNEMILFEIRPQFDDPKIKNEYPFAKSKFVKTRSVWKIFWKLSSGKWSSYEPVPEVKSLDEVLDVIEKDEHSCFFG